jgi:hypothetical protein
VIGRFNGEYPSIIGSARFAQARINLTERRYFMKIIGTVSQMIFLPVLIFFPVSETIARDYATNFPLNENPISENGNWVGGQSAGNNLWGNIRTNGTMAFGVSEPTPFGDPTAILDGTWGPNQTAQATVKIIKTPKNYCCHEVEVRLRTTIHPAAHTITGYEVYCSVMPSPHNYCHIASWGGPNGAWVNMESKSPALYLKNNDVLKGTVTGTNPVTITAYVNGIQIMSVQDAGNFTFSDGKKYGPWTSGAPGIGFFNNTGDGNWSYFGLSSFSATDGNAAACPAISARKMRRGIPEFKEKAFNATWACLRNLDIIDWRPNCACLRYFDILESTND